MREEPKSRVAADDRRRLAGLRRRLEQRAMIVDAVRGFFRAGGFLEVETPLRIPSPAPELHIDLEPAGDRFLAASPELQMKRLLAAGYGRVFQVSRCFRRAERGATHEPEFTMLEWYRAGGGIDDLLADCEQLLGAAAAALGSHPSVARGAARIDLTPPFERIDLRERLTARGGHWPQGPADLARFDVELVDLVEPSLPPERPVFLVGYPAAAASLARLDPRDPSRAERFELYAGGLELANGFAELVDPVEQRARFEREAAARAAAGKPSPPLDERFLAALELGLGPAAGIALGIDRLVMLLTGAERIDQVVAFPDGTV